MRVAARALVCLSLLAASSGCPGRVRPNPIPAGASWIRLETVPYKGKQDDIFFVDADTGWYGNGAGLLYKTTDGGKSWTQIVNKPGTYFRALGFVDAQHGFAGNIAPGYFPGVTDETPLYETTDGGVTWVPVSVPLPPGSGICAIDIVEDKFVNAGVLDRRTVIHAGGRVGGPAHVVRSVDGGKTWKLLTLPAEAAMVLDVKFFDASTGIVVSASDREVERSHAQVLRTTDGGATWSVVYESARPFEIAWKASFPTRDVGYVSVQSYNPDTTVTERHVAKTTDNGRTWRELSIGKDVAQNEYGIGFVTEDVGWVGATKNGFATVDGGRTWSAVDLGRATNKFRIVRMPAGGIVVYAIGVDLHKLDARTNTP